MNLIHSIKLMEKMVRSPDGHQDILMLTALRNGDIASVGGAFWESLSLDFRSFQVD